MMQGNVKETQNSLPRGQRTFITKSNELQMKEFQKDISNVHMIGGRENVQVGTRPKVKPAVIPGKERDMPKVNVIGGRENMQVGARPKVKAAVIPRKETVRPAVSKAGTRGRARSVPVMPRKLKSAAQYTKDIPSATSDLNMTWTPYECACCLNDVRFEYMVQCYEGHLFCIQCLQRYAREAVYGAGQGSLICLAENCNQTFPESQLQRALPDTLKARLEERIQQEQINKAELKNFFRCSFCNCGAVLDDNQMYFICPNEKCKKVFCKHCQVEESAHRGLRCSQIEKKEETDIRKEYEEKMAAAKIRECQRCKAKFTKEEGCNKIICRCGTKMCYICRKTIVDYRHFCEHVRSPGKNCNRCKACKLFTNCEEDDEMAIIEIKNEAREARGILGFEEKEIGAPLKRRI